MSYNNQVNSNEFIFESEYIEIKNDGNIVEAKNGVKIIANNKIEITADESLYDKLTLKLFLKGNVVLVDRERDIKILSEEAIYEKNNEESKRKPEHDQEIFGSSLIYFSLKHKANSY